MSNLSEGIRQNVMREVAIRMIRDGKYDDSEIVDICCLTLEQVKELRKEMKSKQSLPFIYRNLARKQFRDALLKLEREQSLLSSLIPTKSQQCFT